MVPESTVKAGADALDGTPAILSMKGRMHTERLSRAVLDAALAEGGIVTREVLLDVVADRNDAEADRDRLAAENEKLREALRALDKLTRWSYPATIDEPDKCEAWFVRSDDIDRVLAALTREDNDGAS